MSGKLEIIPATDAHAAELAEFIRQVWDPAATAASVLAARQLHASQNVAEPGIAPPTFIAIQNGRILGYVTTIPVRLWDGQQDESPAYLMKGLMVLPEFRGGPIGYHVLKLAAAKLPRSAGLAVAEPARRLFAGLGYKDLGGIPNYIRPLAPGRIMQRIDLAQLGLSSLPAWAPGVVRLGQRTGLALFFGGLGGVALNAVAAARRLGSGVTTAVVDPATIAAELDALWMQCRPKNVSAVVRNAAYLLPRYPVGGDSAYRWVAARRGGKLCGVAIVRQPRAEGDERLRGVKVATLSDMVFAPDDAKCGLALLGAAERIARQLGGDALLGSTSLPSQQRLLKQQCYVPLGGNVHLLFRDTTPPAIPFASELTGWYLTRGDGGSDEVF